MLLGIPGDNTFSNYQEANRTFWRQTVLPLVQRTTEALNEWLTPAYGTTLDLRPDLDDIPALSSEQDALWSRIDAATFLTDDEKRAAIGYGPKGESSGDASAKLFNPNQPRDDHGRWSSGDGGDSGDTGDGGSDGNGGDDPPTDNANPDAAPQTPKIGDYNNKPQDAADKPKPPDRYTVSLEAEEKGGGHTLRDHVDVTDADLLAELQKRTYRLGPFVLSKMAEGRFLSPESANDLVNRTLEDNHAQVDAVANGESEKETLKTRFGYPTGTEAYRIEAKDEPALRNTYEVTVVIRRDTRAPNGYRVLTAYPMNQTPN